MISREYKMAQLSKLSKSQLETRIQETQAELNRRGAISKATQDIVKILKKYNLTSDDIDLKTLVSNRKPNSKIKAAGSPSKQKKTRAKVAPKFKSLDAAQKWTGRGRAPGWVVALCEAENLTIDAFKKDPRFKL